MAIEYICLLMAAFSISITIYECMYVRKKIEEQEEERYME
jgi:hypothetical protein